MPPGGSEQELLALRQVQVREWACRLGVVVEEQPLDANKTPLQSYCFPDTCCFCCCGAPPPCCALLQEELIESKVIKPPPEAALLAKAAAKGRKAAKRSQKAAAAAAGGSAAAAAAAAVGGGAAPRQYSSPGGFVVLVGRNNKQNDVLSHQIAKPGDVWMHVRGMPGSHTVIRVPAGQQPEQRDLQYAADLAAWFSKGREAGKVDVIVARAEHLKKFKGAKPGQVLVTQEEANIVARPRESVAALAAAAGGVGGE